MKPLASLAIGGAAQGALAMAAIAGVEILSRLGTPLLSPLRDLSLEALGGAAAGLVIGALRRVHALRALAPFGIVLGAGIALLLWLPGVAGGKLVGPQAARTAAIGALWLAVGAGLGQAVGVALRRLPGPAPRVARDLGVILLLGLPAVLPPGGRGGSSERPNVLLLTIDTLRADRLGFGGHPRPTSPHLDRLARGASAAVSAVTPIPRTLPAFASLMTASHPHTHGVRDNFHYELGPGARTLAEDLAERGWATAAVNSNPVLSPDCGIYQGFESASDRGNDWSRLGIVGAVQHLATLLEMRRTERAEVITDLALDWLRRRPADRPFFLWVHWLSPHMPYSPAPPYDRVFDPGYEGEFRSEIGYDTISKGDMTYRNPLSPRVREHAKALYDGEVATSDRALGRLLREMERRGELRNTAILFTADHGESLDEHGYFFNHGDFVYGPAANVPLVWRGTRPESGLRTRPISLVDCAPALLLPATGEPAGPESGEELFGESGFCRFPHLNDRLGWLLPREIAQSPHAVPDWSEKWAEQANRAKQRFVQIGGWKLVRSPRPDGDGIELFDLTRDPGETRDVSAAFPAERDALLAKLDAWMEEGRARSTPATTRTLDEATRERMKALGYVGN